MASYHRLDDLKVSLNSINNRFQDIIPQYKELIDLKYQNDLVSEKLTQFEREGFTVLPKTKQRVEEYNKNLTDIIGTKLYKTENLKTYLPKTKGQGFDFEFVSIICKSNLVIGEQFIDYTPRENSSEKKPEDEFYVKIDSLFKKNVPNAPEFKNSDELNCVLDK